MTAPKTTTYYEQDYAGQQNLSQTLELTAEEIARLDEYQTRTGLVLWAPKKPAPAKAGEPTQQTSA